MVRTKVCGAKPKTYTIKKSTHPPVGEKPSGSREPISSDLENKMLLKPTEKNIIDSFIVAAKSNPLEYDFGNDRSIYFILSAISDLKSMLSEYAEGKRIVDKLFNTTIFECADVEVTDGSKCEISPRSKAVRRYYNDKFSISVCEKWRKYVKSYISVCSLKPLVISIHKQTAFDLERKISISTSMAEHFITDARVLFKPPLAGAKFPKLTHQKLSEWFSL